MEQDENKQKQQDENKQQDGNKKLIKNLLYFVVGVGALLGFCVLVLWMVIV